MLYGVSNIRCRVAVEGNKQHFVHLIFDEDGETSNLLRITYPFPVPLYNFHSSLVILSLQMSIQLQSKLLKPV